MPAGRWRAACGRPVLEDGGYYVHGRQGGPCPPPHRGPHAATPSLLKPKTRPHDTDKGGHQVTVDQARAD